MRLVGITGSIASGKSETSKYILSKGYSLIDADFISRDISKKGNIGYNRLIEVFEDIVDSKGDINRKKLSNIVFNDKEQLKVLNSILHPLIFDEINTQINKHRDESLVFLDAPLLFETNLDKKCDEVILLYCNEDIQLDRIVKRDSITVQEAKLIIANQMSVLEKKIKSNYIVENNNSIEKLHLKLDIVLDILQTQIL